MSLQTCTTKLSAYTPPSMCESSLLRTYVSFLTYLQIVHVWPMWRGRQAKKNHEHVSVAVFCVMYHQRVQFLPSQLPTQIPTAGTARPSPNKDEHSCSSSKPNTGKEYASYLRWSSRLRSVHARRGAESHCGTTSAKWMVRGHLSASALKGRTIVVTTSPLSFFFSFSFFRGIDDGCPCYSPGICDSRRFCVAPAFDCVAVGRCLARGPLERPLNEFEARPKRKRREGYDRIPRGIRSRRCFWSWRKISARFFIFASILRQLRRLSGICSVRCFLLLDRKSVV